MESAATLDGYELEAFSEPVIDELHAFFEENAGLYSFPARSFRQASIDDPDFKPGFSLVLRDGDGQIAGACLVIARRTRINFKGRSIPYKTTTLNMFAVRRDLRRRGLGTAMLEELFGRLKRAGVKRLGLMTSVPNYIWPGLDPGYTAGYFFLKSLGFKRTKGEHVNLCHDIPGNLEQPPSKMGRFVIERLTRDDLPATLEYVKKNHPGFWPEEFQLSMLNDPVTTFVAKDEESGTVVGFASHSISFPGSFGPTGVLKSARGQGLGGLLLKWCTWDMKTNLGVDRCIIRWVVGDTVKFYSKSIGARIHRVYWGMKKKL